MQCDYWTVAEDRTRAREQKIADQGKTLREYSAVVGDATARIFAF